MFCMYMLYDCYLAFFGEDRLATPGLRALAVVLNEVCNQHFYAGYKQQQCKK